MQPIEGCKLNFKAADLKFSTEVDMEVEYTVKTPMVDGDYIDIALGGFSANATDVVIKTDEVSIDGEVTIDMPVIVTYEVVTVMITVVTVTTTTTVTSGRRAEQAAPSCYESLKSGGTIRYD